MGIGVAESSTVAAAAAGDVEMAEADVQAQVPAVAAHHAAEQEAAGNAAVDDGALPEVDHPPAKPWVPDHLQRLLSLLQQQQQQQQQQGINQAQLLVLTVHAAMLESGFQPWQQQAAAAAGGDSSSSSSSAAELLQRQQQLLLPVLQGSSSVYPLAYLLPGDGGSDAAAAAAAAGSSSAPSGVQVEVKAVDVGHHLVLAGSVKTAAAAAAGVGSSSDSLNGSSKLVLSLSIPKSHVSVLQSSISVEGSAITTTAAAAASTAASSADQQAASDPGRANEQQQQQPGWPLCAFSGLQQLWVLLKDRLFLPLLVAGCAAAGLVPPAGLTSLPYEMQEAVLALLGVSLGAALCCMFFMV
jgi:hypothetical protein